MTQPVIGFIGLGLMGLAIAQRLVTTGHTVIGLDADSARTALASDGGITIAADLADLAGRCDLIHLCVSSPAAVDEIIAGSGGIATLAQVRASIVIDHSTTDIATTQRVAAALADSSIDFIDAPVSGGPAAAEKATLAIMAGGGDAAIATVQPVMAHLGTFTHMGAVTAGQATKLVNQTLVLNNYCVIAEAVRLAEAYGVDVAKIPAALASGHAGSNLLPIMTQRMSARDWTPHGHTRIVLKDLEMLSEAARRRQVAMPMSAQALTLYRMLAGRGMSEADGSSVFTLLEPHAANDA